MDCTVRLFHMWAQSLFQKKLSISARGSAYNIQYDHHMTIRSNGQAEMCIKVVKKTMKKCYETDAGINMSLIQIRSIPISPGLQSLSMLLLNRPSRGLLLKLNKAPLVCNNNESNHTVLTNRQPQSNKEAGVHISFSFLPVVSTIVVQ